ncbi:hypothetical protein [Catellatospora coxensis]|nr:hypothetical protein [Catellatospora coxensis]
MSIAVGIGLQLGLDVTIQFTQLYITGTRRHWDGRRSGGAVLAGLIGGVVGPVVFAGMSKAITRTLGARKGPDVGDRWMGSIPGQVFVGAATEFTAEQLADLIMNGRIQQSDHPWAAASAGAIDGAVEGGVDKLGGWIRGRRDGASAGLDGDIGKITMPSWDVVLGSVRDVPGLGGPGGGGVFAAGLLPGLEGGPDRIEGPAGARGEFGFDGVFSPAGSWFAGRVTFTGVWHRPDGTVLAGHYTATGRIAGTFDGTFTATALTRHDNVIIGQAAGTGRMDAVFALSGTFTPTPATTVPTSTATAGGTAPASGAASTPATVRAVETLRTTTTGTTPTGTDTTTTAAADIRAEPAHNTAVTPTTTSHAAPDPDVGAGAWPEASGPRTVTDTVSVFGGQTTATPAQAAPQRMPNDPAADGPGAATTAAKPSEGDRNDAPSGRPVPPDRAGDTIAADPTGTHPPSARGTELDWSGALVAGPVPLVPTRLLSPTAGTATPQRPIRPVRQAPAGDVRARLERVNPLRDSDIAGFRTNCVLAAIVGDMVWTETDPDVAGYQVPSADHAPLRHLVNYARDVDEVGHGFVRVEGGAETVAAAVAATGDGRGFMAMSRPDDRWHVINVFHVHGAAVFFDVQSGEQVQPSEVNGLVLFLSLDKALVVPGEAVTEPELEGMQAGSTSGSSDPHVDELPASGWTRVDEGFLHRSVDVLFRVDGRRRALSIRDLTPSTRPSSQDHDSSPTPRVDMLGLTFAAAAGPAHVPSPRAAYGDLHRRSGTSNRELTEPRATRATGPGSQPVSVDRTAPGVIDMIIGYGADSDFSDGVIGTDSSGESPAGSISDQWAATAEASSLFTDGDDRDSGLLELYEGITQRRQAAAEAAARLNRLAERHGFEPIAAAMRYVQAHELQHRDPRMLDDHQFERLQILHREAAQTQQSLRDAARRTQATMRGRANGLRTYSARVRDVARGAARTFFIPTPAGIRARARTRALLKNMVNDVGSRELRDRLGYVVDEIQRLDSRGIRRTAAESRDRKVLRQELTGTLTHEISRALVERADRLDRDADTMAEDLHQIVLAEIGEHHWLRVSHDLAGEVTAEVKRLLPRGPVQNRHTDDEYGDADVKLAEEARNTKYLKDPALTDTLLSIGRSAYLAQYFHVGDRDEHAALAFALLWDDPRLSGVPITRLRNDGHVFVIIGPPLHPNTPVVDAWTHRPGSPAANRFSNFLDLRGISSIFTATPQQTDLLARGRDQIHTDLLPLSRIPRPRDSSSTDSLLDGPRPAHNTDVRSATTYVSSPTLIAYDLGHSDGVIGSDSSDDDAFFGYPRNSDGFSESGSGRDDGFDGDPGDSGGVIGSDSSDDSGAGVDLGDADSVIESDSDGYSFSIGGGDSYIVPRDRGPDSDGDSHSFSI